MAVKNLLFARIDDRLIHGQICSAWIKEFDIKEVLLADDETFADQFVIDMYTMFLPDTCKLTVTTVQDAIPLLKAGLENPTMLIVRSPEALKTITDAGVEISQTNIGGLGKIKDRTRLHKNMFASSLERGIFKEFLETGMKLEIQILPSEENVNVATLLGA